MTNRHFIQKGIFLLKKARFSRLKSCPALTPKPKFLAKRAASTKEQQQHRGLSDKEMRMVPYKVRYGRFQSWLPTLYFQLRSYKDRSPNAMVCEAFYQILQESMICLDIPTCI